MNKKSNPGENLRRVKWDQVQVHKNLLVYPYFTNAQHSITNIVMNH